MPNKRSTSTTKRPILRLTQTKSGQTYRIELALELPGQARRTATADFTFQITPDDEADICWYLEDYLQNPFDPAPDIAARIEQRMMQIGAELFSAVFDANNDTRDLWSECRTHLSNMRVEVVTGISEAVSIPWELIRDTRTDIPLALRAQAFIRTHPNPAQRPRVQPVKGKVRILLVISRPGGQDDVPYRSVATHLLKPLANIPQHTFELDVLRPATFAELAKMLRRAKSAGSPYHAIHFDGHGIYTDPKSSGYFAVENRAGEHGYLAFENPKLDENIELVSGPQLGRLLVETEVPVLILNACRSAHADPSQLPHQKSANTNDPHSQVRSYGSLAQEIMEAGVAGVIAMRYNVYVVTAAQYVADLYSELVGGHTLGEAATFARKQLQDAPLRDIGYKPQSLQDWSVPIVYEAAPLALFPATEQDTLNLIFPTETGSRGEPVSTAQLPPSPDLGFFGRDETLLALERAFYDHHVIVLHGWAGSGKTSTALEFARWYTLTGGVLGPVLFTSFAQYKTLDQVLATLGDAIAPQLQQLGINWLALTDKERRTVSLQVLQQVPVLWIWDNVEEIAGFPTSTDSAWSISEQQELADFLRAVRNTQGKFLLTSRRDEHDWLGQLPYPISLPPMAIPDQIQMVSTLAKKFAQPIHNLSDWRSLLQYAQGNPLTLSVVMQQALEAGLTTKEQIDVFVEELRQGAVDLHDDPNLGRDSSLAASLSYGLRSAFNQDEQKRFSLLHFFQDFVNIDVFHHLGNPNAFFHVPDLSTLSRDELRALLQRGTKIGLLTEIVPGMFTIHPALSSLLKRTFDTAFSEPGSSEQALRAFVESVARYATFCHAEFGRGQRELLSVLTFEERNLLYAWRIALKHGWHLELISIMQGLTDTYIDS